MEHLDSRWPNRSWTDSDTRAKPQIFSYTHCTHSRFGSCGTEWDARVSAITSSKGSLSKAQTERVIMWDRFRQIPSKRKQLFVLLIVASWITLHLWIAWKDVGYRAYQLPIEDAVELDIAMTFLVFCVPAVLFGGILVWWVGRPERKDRQ